MSYPESIPILRGKAAKAFLYRIEHPEEFPLTPEQKEFFRDALKVYKEMESQGTLDDKWHAEGKLVSHDGILGLEGLDGSVCSLRSWMLFMLGKNVRITIETLPRDE